MTVPAGEEWAPLTKKMKTPGRKQEAVVCFKELG